MTKKIKKEKKGLINAIVDERKGDFSAIKKYISKELKSP